MDLSQYGFMLEILLFHLHKVPKRVKILAPTSNGTHISMGAKFQYFWTILYLCLKLTETVLQHLTSDTIID